MRLAVLTSHPIQYYAPLFAHLATRLDLHVLYAGAATPAQQSAAGFGTAFSWDLDLTAGYSHEFLENVARQPDPTRFSGCDTPNVGARLRKGRFDAVLALGWHLKSQLQGIWAAKTQRLPVFIRGDSQLASPRSPLKRALKSLTYPAFLRLFDAALYVGQRNRTYYEHYGYPHDRLFYSPHCVDTERFSSNATPVARSKQRAALGVTPDTRLVLFAGRLVPYKRPLDLVEAVAGLRTDGVRAEAVVVGAGELEGSLRARAEQQGVPLHLLGFKNQSEMPAVYAASDALLLPSDGKETWGLVANEALAAGLPIVVSNDAGSAKDLAADGVVGRRYPMGDTAACTRALAALLASPPSKAEIAAISSRFTLEAAGDGVIAALTDSPRKRTRPSGGRVAANSGEQSP